MTIEKNEATTQLCQECRETHVVTAVAFSCICGRISRRKFQRVGGNLCKECVRKIFWKSQASIVVFLPWGLIGILLVPIYLAQNSYFHAAALLRLRRAASPISR